MVASSTEDSSPAPPAALPRLLLHFAVVLLVVSGIAAALLGWPAAVSSALGVLLAGANMLLMRRIMRGLSAASGGSAAWAIALPFKLIGLVAAAFALVHAGVAQPVPLAIGFALLPLTGVFLPRASSVPPASSRSRLGRANP